VSRHLSQRFWFCLVLALGPILAALAARQLEPAAVAAPFLTVLVLSTVEGWWLPVRVESVALSAARVIEGDELELSLDVVADHRVPWLEVELQLPATLAPLAPIRSVLTLQGRRRITVPLRAERWGAAGPEWAVTTSRDRYGLTELVQRHPLHAPVRVHPPAEQLNSLVPLYRERPVTGEHRSRHTGSGSELAEVRPYRFGDPVRMIHHGLSQRRGQPMVIERHPDQSSDIVLLIDSAQDLGVDLDTTLRWTVTAATALTERHLRAQDRVGLIDVGRGVRWLPTRLGRRHLHTVVDALLATEVLPRQEREAVFRVPADLPRSATIVAISPLLAESTLSALVELRCRGHEVLVIKPEVPADDDESISLLARRIFRAGNELNQRWLLERGAVVIPWSHGDSLEHLMRRVIRNLGRARQRP
jgi:uncharacterized protein (DUF58 family)